MIEHFTTQFKHGQSNPTYVCSVRDKSTKLVLRKQPPGKLLRGAHAVDREFRVMNALQGSAVPVPKTRLFCPDSGLNETFELSDYAAS